MQSRHRLGCLFVTISKIYFLIQNTYTFNDGFYIRRKCFRNKSSKVDEEGNIQENNTDTTGDNKITTVINV